MEKNIHEAYPEEREKKRYKARYKRFGPHRTIKKRLKQKIYN